MIAVAMTNGWDCQYRIPSQTAALSATVNERAKIQTNLLKPTTNCLSRGEWVLRILARVPTHPPNNPTKAPSNPTKGPMIAPAMPIDAAALAAAVPFTAVEPSVAAVADTFKAGSAAITDVVNARLGALRASAVSTRAATCSRRSVRPRDNR